MILTLCLSVPLKIKDWSVLGNKRAGRRKENKRMGGRKEKMERSKDGKVYSEKKERC